MAQPVVDPQQPRDGHRGRHADAQQAAGKDVAERTEHNTDDSHEFKEWKERKEQREWEEWRDWKAQKDIRRGGEDNPQEPQVKYVLSGQPTGWAAMDKVVRDYDEEKVKDCKEDIDTLLVFVSIALSVFYPTSALMFQHC